MRPISPDPDERVEHPVMIHRWESLTFLHWSFDPDAVQRLLPDALEVDTFEGRAWVGLVPFRMKIRLPRGPFVPWLSIFPETNVRTYVVGPDGRRGIWFCSLDVPRLGAAVVARSTYRIPYCWSRMRISYGAGIVSYEGRRRWPAPRGARDGIAVEIGEVVAAADVTEREHFLTARWGLYSSLRNGLAYAPVEHARWPLQRARAVGLEDALVRAAGLPEPSDEPVVLYSPGVDVRIGRPVRLQRAGSR